MSCGIFLSEACRGAISTSCFISMLPNVMHQLWGYTATQTDAHSRCVLSSAPCRAMPCSVVSHSCTDSHTRTHAHTYRRTHTVTLEALYLQHFVKLFLLSDSPAQHSVVRHRCAMRCFGWNGSMKRKGLTKCESASSLWQCHTTSSQVIVSCHYYHPVHGSISFKQS